MSEAANQNTNEKPPTTGQTEQEEPIKPPEPTLVTLTKTDHKLEDGDATPTTEASNQEAEEANTAKPKQKSNKRKRKETGTKEEHPAKKQRTVKSKSSGEYDPTLWTTKDDLLLKEMVLNTLDITKVAKSTKFSKKFTQAEVEARWQAMLYDPNVASNSAKEMAKLPPLHKRVLWSPVEEELLKQEVSKEPFLGFQAVLEKFRPKFHVSRTAKSLEAHYYRMKRTGVLEKDKKLGRSTKSKNSPERTSSPNAMSPATAISEIGTQPENTPPLNAAEPSQDSNTMISNVLNIGTTSYPVTNALNRLPVPQTLNIPQHFSPQNSSTLHPIPQQNNTNILHTTQTKDIHSKQELYAQTMHFPSTSQLSADVNIPSELLHQLKPVQRSIGKYFHQ